MAGYVAFGAIAPQPQHVAQHLAPTSASPASTAASPPVAAAAAPAPTAAPAPAPAPAPTRTSGHGAATADRARRNREAQRNFRLRQANKQSELERRCARLEAKLAAARVANRLLRQVSMNHVVLLSSLVGAQGQGHAHYMPDHAYYEDHKMHHLVPGAGRSAEAAGVRGLVPLFPFGDDGRSGDAGERADDADQTADGGGGDDHPDSDAEPRAASPVPALAAPPTDAEVAGDYAFTTRALALLAAYTRVE